MSGRESTVSVAVLQMAAEPGDVEGNRARLVSEVRRYGTNADLVVAPELVTVGYDLDLVRSRGHDLAEAADGPTVRELAAACAEIKTTAVAGFLEEADGVLYDSVVTVTPEGAIEIYRKTHLYPPEQAVFASGADLQTVPTPAGRLGPMLCFEHAFPEIATALALRGAQILVIPSAVPFGFQHLLMLRTRARAQDNQIYAVACNMTGHGFCGSSLVSNPRGEVIVSAGTGETVLLAELDLDAVQRERVQEPALRLRRPELYAAPAETP
jgi:predicted amidohydrolase